MDTEDTEMDTEMDVTEGNHMEGMKKEVENGLCNEVQQNLSLGEGPSSSCRRVSVRSRPRLQSTKSFPPYSQCIGGLGEDEDEEGDGDWEDELDSITSQASDVVMGDDGKEVTERKEDFELNARCARDEVKAKWRFRRRERLGGSFECETGRRERTRWSMKRRTEETWKEKERGQRQHCGGVNSSFEVKSKEEEGEEKRSPVSRAQGEEGESVETRELEEEEAGELPGLREGSTSHQWSSPHPILSKLMHSSSSSSCCSSISLSSAESDEVFSEGEDVGSKRRTFRKCRSWKTYLTMMHWSMRRQSSWVQLAGHQGNFQLSEGGEVLKLYSEVEERCLDRLMRDQLRPFVPQYHGLIMREGHCYVRLDDLLSGLRKPVIMDCKMGVRTFQEEELIKARTKASLRSDMYQKMVISDPSAPSAEEHAQKAVTKLRYLQWRDTTSSTSTLGFRIEGIMMEDGSVQRDFRKIFTSTQATEALLYFTRSHLDILKAYHSRLLSLSDALRNSLFFKTHEVIGSSLLFVHDHSSKASVWMIDFGKTTPVPDSSEVRHDVPWAEGNREDGYLIGLTSLIASLGQAISVASWQQQDVCGGEKSVT
uniref:inositol-trisphosphate 3-kinase A n=1 Tax=Semicossyphus pulcher TaxID=241346 RepID=UPI0037E9829E